MPLSYSRPNRGSYRVAKIPQPLFTAKLHPLVKRTPAGRFQFHTIFLRFNSARFGTSLRMAFAMFSLTSVQKGVFSAFVFSLSRVFTKSVFGNRVAIWMHTCLFISPQRIYIP